MLGKIIKVDTVEYKNSKNEDKKIYKITFESDNKKIKGNFSYDFVNNYLSQNAVTLKEIIQKGELLELEIVDDSFTNDKNEFIKFKRVKFFNLLDSDGTKIFYKK